MRKSIRAALCGAVATLALAATVAPAATQASACPDYTWKWKGTPPGDG